ncbi:hypothetical protein ACS0TY_015625 [Phlomoides rotata]
MMLKTRVGEEVDGGKMQLYAEMDPSERYGRSKEVLGKGAMKTVYRAFDELLGTEVAWNQVKLDHAFKSPDEIQRLHSEVHLLNNLKHDSIMKFRASWINVDRRSFNFITELFTSGTLREYRMKYKRVSIRAIKDWAQQILQGLDYLHKHDPPVIHRDLKCDNIFVNGHLGQVKIGDLGLAAILSGSHHAHSVIGTPEFMAPELYEEEYDELVDIYSFGMCVLEMLTSEYPYNECSNPAQIYKKVTSGKLPESFHRINDAEAQRFVGRCLEKVLNRPSAHELLNDPFLSVEEIEEFPLTKIPSNKAFPTGNSPESPRSVRVQTNMTIKGTLDTEDDTIFLKVQISDKDGPTRNIHFPFDITSDTAPDVAIEMVKELEITDWEPIEIAKMIDEEISNLVPSWKNSTSSDQIPQMQSFISYDDDDDDDENTPHNPFYSCSSFSSSNDSLPCLFSHYDWLHEEGSVHDDTSSQSSSCSEKYDNLKFFSASDEDLISSFEKEVNSISKNQKCTRFGPEGSMIKNCNNLNVVDCSSKRKPKLVRSGSMVDIRSQLLQRTLVEEINKLRLFKTVGAVENIGFQQLDPGDQMMNAFSGRSARESGIRGKFKW